MRALIFGGLLALPLCAQTLQVADVSNRVAAVYVRGVSGACTFDLREDSSSGTVHPAGASPLTIETDGTTRLYQIGQPKSNLTLEYDKTYYLGVSGCVSSTSTTFRTAAPRMGATVARPMPFDSTKPFNVDTPLIDWTSTSKIIDPLTGAPLVPFISANNAGYDQSWNPAKFPYYSDCGAGISNTSNIPTGSAGTVTTWTATTNSCYLYVAVDASIGWGPPWFGSGPWSSTPSFENFGLELWGSGTDATAANRIMQFCVETDAASPCTLSGGVEVTMPTGANTQQVTGGATAFSVFPTTYATNGFSGWNTIIRRDKWPTYGTIDSAVAGVLTISSPSGTNYFPAGLTVGAGVYVATSAPTCPNNVCHLLSYQHAGQITVSENITLGSVAFAAYPWRLRVGKKTATGNVDITFRWALRGNGFITTIAQGVKCSVEFARNDGTRGTLCSVPRRNFSEWSVYFVPSNGSLPVLLSIGSIPYTAQMSGWNAADKPYTGSGGICNVATFSLIDQRDWYCSTLNPSGKFIVMKLHYNGDFATPLSINGGIGGDFQEVNENITWTNVTPPSTGGDIGAKVTAAYPSYRSDIYGTFPDHFSGITGDYAFYYQQYQSQDWGMWVAVQRLTDGALMGFWHSVTGCDPDGNLAVPNGGLPAVAHGGVHSFPVSDTVEGVVASSIHPLPTDQGRVDQGNTAKWHSGPWLMNLTHVYKSGAWSTNTSLPWPADSTYDRTCPSDLAAVYQNLGATGNNCAHLRVTTLSLCNQFPKASPSEKTEFGTCDWNSSYSKHPHMLIRLGSLFVDRDLPTPSDQERMLVVQINSITGSTDKEIVVFRNATQEYSCAQVGSPSTYFGCVIETANMQHANAWVPRVQQSGQWLQYPGPVVAEPFRDLGVGHYGFGLCSSATGSVSMIAITYGKYCVSMDDLSSTASFQRYTDLTFNGISQLNSGMQHYIQLKGAHGFALDSNPYNPSSGQTYGNVLSNAIGTRTISAGTGTNVWKVGASTSCTDYKKCPLEGVVGPYLLKDVSPADISAAANYSMCEVIVAGDCGQGSVGEIFVKAPGVYSATTNATTAMGWANIPVVGHAQPAAGFVRQFRADVNDHEGRNARLITSILQPTFTHWPFWVAFPQAGGSNAVVTSAGILQGMKQTAFNIRLPEWRNDVIASRGETLTGLPVSVGARSGFTHARAEFGPNANLYCTERSKMCYTDASIAPFAFEDESSLAATSCSSGCTITIPAIPGEVTYYRIRYCANAGCTGTTAVTKITSGRAQ